MKKLLSLFLVCVMFATLTVNASADNRPSYVYKVNFELWDKLVESEDDDVFSVWTVAWKKHIQSLEDREILILEELNSRRSNKAKTTLISKLKGENNIMMVAFEATKSEILEFSVGAIVVIEFEGEQAWHKAMAKYHREYLKISCPDCGRPCICKSCQIIFNDVKKPCNCEDMKWHEMVAKNHKENVTLFSCLACRLPCVCLSCEIVFKDFKEPCECTIFDVVQILKYLAGFESLQNYHHFDVFSDSIIVIEPTIFNALEILKKLANT